MSVAPDYNRSIDDYRREYAERSVVAPGLGLNEQKPSPLKKAGAALSGSAVGRAMSSAYRKTTETVSSAVAEVTTLDKPTGPSDVLSMDRPVKPSANFYVSLAKLKERSNNHDEAIAHYNRALEIDPDDLPALLGLAHQFDRQNKLDEAVAIYKRAVKAHPKDAAPLNDLGLCYARQGNLEASREALTKAVELRPDRALYRNNLATVLVELGDVEGAYAQLAGINGAAVAHYNVGHLLHRRGKNDQALKQFQLALAADPNFVAAQQWVEQLGGGKSQGASMLAREPHGPNPGLGATSTTPAPYGNGAPALTAPAMAAPAVTSQPASSRREMPSFVPPARTTEPAIPPTPDNIPAYQQDSQDAVNLVPDLTRRPMPNPASYPTSRF